MIVRIDGVMGLEDSIGGESKEGSLRKDSWAWTEKAIIRRQGKIIISPIISLYLIPDINIFLKIERLFRYEACRKYNS